MEVIRVFDSLSAANIWVTEKAEIGACKAFFRFHRRAEGFARGEPYMPNRSMSLTVNGYFLKRERGIGTGFGCFKDCDGVLQPFSSSACLFLCRN